MTGRTDIWAGVLFAALGLGWFMLARGLAFGSASRMGPGFFPVAVASLLAGLGLAIGIAALVRGGEGFEPARARPVAMVFGSVVVFGLAIERFGLLLSAALLVAIAGLALPGGRPAAVALLAAGLAAASWLLFVVVLGIPLAVLPR